MDRAIKGGIDRAVCFSYWLVYMPARCQALLIDFNKADHKKLCFSHGEEEKLAKKLEKVYLTHLIKLENYGKIHSPPKRNE